MISKTVSKTSIIFLGVVFMTIIIGAIAIAIIGYSNTAAEPSQSTESIPPIQGQFGQLTLATEFPDSPDSVSVYRVDTMDSINEKIGDPFSEKSSIPSVEEAPKLAEASLKKYGGLPKDDRLEYVAPHYLNQYNLQNGENKQIAGLNTQVKYVQIINSSPVSGARINLDLGENGEILAIWKDWITSYTQTREIKIITVRTAYEKLLTKGTVDKIQGNIPQGTKVTNITLGYYWTGDPGGVPMMVKSLNGSDSNENRKRLSFYRSQNAIHGSSHASVFGQNPKRNPLIFPASHSSAGTAARSLAGVPEPSYGHSRNPRPSRHLRSRSQPSLQG